MHPLVESFGYQNVKVPGYEADDVIATLAGRAQREGIDVMVVTGDRDLFQLIEPGVRIMATGRGISDKTASQLIQEWGDLEGVLSNIDSISGAKRKENLTEHAENARISKQLATAVRDVDVEVDFPKVIARETDRS